MKKWERKASTEGGPWLHNDNGVIKSTVGDPACKQWQISVEGTLGTPREHALSGISLDVR